MVLLVEHVDYSCSRARNDLTISCRSTDLEGLRVGVSIDPRAELESEDRRRFFRGILPPVIMDLLGQPEFVRLAHVSQMTARFTETGADLTHSRLDHTLRVLEMGHILGRAVHLPPDEHLVLLCACLLHDIKHPALNHLGERILTETSGVAFDHDEETLSELRHPDSGLRKTLAKHGVNPDEVADALDDAAPRLRHIHFITKELADRLGYLEEDYLGSSLPDYLKSMALRAAQDVLTSIGLRDGQIYFDDAKPVVQLLALRRILFQEVVFCPASIIANQVLLEGTREAVREGRISPDDLRNGTDEDVVRNLAPRWHALVDGPIEQSIDVVAHLPIGDISAVCAGKRPQAVAAELQSFLRERSCYADIFCAATPDYEKSVSVPIAHKGRLREFLFSATVPERMRGLTVGISRDADQDLRERVQSMVADFLRHPPFDHSVTYPHRIPFGPVDNLLYELTGPVRHLPRDGALRRSA